MESIFFPDESLSNKEAAEKNDSAHRQLLDDVKKTFGTPEGNRVFLYIMDHCRVFDDIFTGNSKTFLLEGKRQVGLHLLILRGLNSIEGLEKLKAHQAANFVEREE